MTDFPPDVVVRRLASSSVFSRCSPQEVVRLLPFLRERRLEPGETLCRAGEPATEIWLVLHGTLRLRLGEDSSRDISDGLIGEEAALGIGSYLSEIVATNQATVLALPKDVIPGSIKDGDNRALAFCQSVIHFFTSATPSMEKSAPDGATLTAALAGWKVLGWIAAVFLPWALLALTGGGSLRWEQRQLAAALLSAAVLWIFRLVPPYVAGLIVVLVCVTLGLVPNSVILSGFASSGFFLAMSVFSLGAVLIDSGVITRVFLVAMKQCPRSATCYDFLAVVAGLALTPVIPSEAERARVLAPLAAQSTQSLGYRPGSRETTRLSLSMFWGLTLFSPMLLTGSPLNLALYGSLPEQVQDGFPWLHWAFAALSASLILLFACSLLPQLLLRGGQRPQLQEDTVDAQLAALGPVRSVEWLAIGGVVLFLGAVSTVSVHKIDHRLIALSVICGYLVLGALGKVQLNVDIDWSSLILLGTTIGVIATISYVGLGAVMAEQLVELSSVMKYHQELFVVILATAVLLAGLVMPLAGGLISLFSIPLAVVNGMNLWIVIFVILLMNDSWVFPSQSRTYDTFFNIVRTHVPYDERLFIRANYALIAVRMLVLVVSVAYWRYLRML